MVPVRLLLRNFLSYREPTDLEFSGIHVACLSGDNGHGKSALLDAITWSLWGKARVTRDDDLVHLGETEMEVEFEFEVGADRYRVLRKRRKGGAGRPGDTALELQAQAAAGWRSLTGNTVKATQARIIELLRLDYDTFINSSFLLQGRADEFTTRPPAERKKVLGDILGLSRYDELAERAKLEARSREGQRLELQTEIGQIDRQTADLDGLVADLDHIRSELRSCEEDVARRKTLVAGLTEAKRLADLQAEQLRAALARLQEAEAVLARLAGEIAGHDQAIAAHQAVIERAGEIEAGFASLDAARAEQAEAGRRAGEALALQERKAALERAIDRARQEVEGERLAAHDLVEALQERASRLDALTADRGRAESLRRESETLAAQMQERRAASRLTRDEAQTLMAMNTALREAMDALRSKLNELAAADAACPLCARPLGTEEKTRIEAAYEQEGSDNARAYRDNKARLAEAEKEADALDQEAEAIEIERADRERRAATHLAEVERDLAEAHAASRDLDGARVRLATAEAALASESFAPERQAELREVAAQLSSLGYDPAHHEELQRRVAASAHFDQAHRLLGEARSLLTHETTALERAKADVGEWTGRRDGACAEAEALRARAGASDDVAARLAHAEAEQRDAESELSRLRQALGAVENGVAERRALLAQRRPKVERLAVVAEERRVYDELAKAFGRQGVQALLIDAALPELTEEANRLLHRMTAGRMSLMITTQRATQKGDMTETLDIRIADELGTRAYETYSGGEAFRVDFALRIALSKLLARRAGAPLPTLVIDEGFGTQDASGRERLIEALTAVQDDFRMVLVVTHIDELRSMFPHRIHVTKTAQGSQVEVF